MSVPIINGIIQKKSNVNSFLPVSTVLMNHPSDVVGMQNHLNIGGTPATYVYKYESFEIMCKNRVYSHILKGSVDYSDNKILIFETDMDVDSGSVVYGAGTSSKKIYSFGTQTGTIRRAVLLDYTQIDSIEFRKFTSI